MKTKYWSCTDFADKVRGTEKPYAAGWDEWDKWHETAKKSHPIRYWVVEKMFDKIQDIIYSPITLWYNIRYYINNRFITKTHVLKTSLEKGVWHDLDNRIFDALCTELVEYVEVELAWRTYLDTKSLHGKYNVPWVFYRKFRSSELGLDNLYWQCTLVYNEYIKDKTDPLYNTKTPQAKAAQEILEIYNWIKNIYPNRPDPYEVSGFNDILKNSKHVSLFSESTDPVIKKQLSVASAEVTRIEDKYKADEEAILIRIIKVRNSLWT